MFQLVYQLNRTRLHLEPEQGFDANNVCWHTPEMELFKEDPETGEQRVDVETLKEICKFYLLEPDRALEVDIRRLVTFVHNVKLVVVK